MKGRIVLTLVIVTLCLTIPAWAQTGYSTLGGTVSDATGARIPGIPVVATNTLTGIVTETVSAEAGTYHFPSLQSGTYKVSAALSGFQTQVYEAVTIGASAQVKLNFVLQVSNLATTVEVRAAPDALLSTTSSSVGQVISEAKVSSLPLAARNVLDLAQTTPGVFGNAIAGQPTFAINVVRDGVSVVDGRYNNGIYSATYTSPDLVDQVTVVVAPVDAETGRGNGQIRMSTRSGTNEYHGSIFEANYNSALAANSWSNNRQGLPTNFLNRNQFGARLGGPIIKNKTFFFVLFEGQRSVSRTPVTATVLTAEARRGIFRYFPGVQNGNAIATNPAVDLGGTPCQRVNGVCTPRTPSQFSVFGLDPGRSIADPSGYVQQILAKMPMPNDFNTGDGLNTAGYTWQRRTSGQDNTGGTGVNSNRDQLNIRLDHNFNSSHKLNLVYSWERDWSDNYQSPWPNGYNGEIVRAPSVATTTYTSALTPRLVNEVILGFRKGKTSANLAWDDEQTGKEVRDLLPRYSGQMSIVRPQIFGSYFINDADSSFGSSNPYYSIGDNLAWNKGKHAFKVGVEYRANTSNGYNSDEVIPRVNLGAGGVAVQGVTGAANSPTAGLTGSSITLAQNLLTDLTGSVGSVIQVFNIRKPSDLTWETYLYKERFIHQREYSAFFKDEWKVNQALTLNLGVRHEWFGVPWESRGLTARPINGSAGAWGISGTGFGDMYSPGRLAGSLTKMEFVGKASTQPSKKLFEDDWNNFAPAVGFSWSLPWFGREKTVLRSGYGISYQRVIRAQSIDTVIGLLPSVGQRTTDTSTAYRSLTQVRLPLDPGIQPLAVVPLTERTQSMTVYDTHQRTPYTQNWNLSLQRELKRDLTLEVKYVGTKGTKLPANYSINDINIFENFILDAFKITAAGGNAPLFDQMLNGLDLGLGAVNGSSVSGSASLRNNSATRSFLANGNVGQLASFLNSSVNFTGVAGGILRNGKLPENFVVANPQFSGVTVSSTFENSSYHSMQTQLSRRFSKGFSAQGTYSWSKTMEGGAVRNSRNRALSKVSSGRTHDVRGDALYQLPIGPGHRLLGGSRGIIARLTERWQFGSIFSILSGAPLSITANTSSFNGSTSNTPIIIGTLPKDFGQVTKVTDGVKYFDGLTQVTDPARAGVTTSQSLQNQFNRFAIQDANGTLILINPTPGTVGNLGQNYLSGPGSIGLDMNLLKRVQISEGKEFEFRIDALNILNHPNFGNPTTDINNTNFGRITNASGARTFVLNGRVSF